MLQTTEFQRYGNCETVSHFTNHETSAVWAPQLPGEFIAIREKPHIRCISTAQQITISCCFGRYFESDLFGYQTVTPKTLP
jgi:hypothetical protein